MQYRCGQVPFVPGGGPGLRSFPFAKALEHWEGPEGGAGIRGRYLMNRV